MTAAEQCEKTVLAEEVSIGAGMTVAVYRGIFAILIANPLQFIFELLSIYLVKIKVSGQKPDENCKLLSLQSFITIIYMVLLCAGIAQVYTTLMYGRPNMIFPTFLYALLLDQLKSIIVLSMVYAIVVRRFMYLSVNEYEYNPIDERPPS